MNDRHSFVVLLATRKAIKTVFSTECEGSGNRDTKREREREKVGERERKKNERWGKSENEKKTSKMMKHKWEHRQQLAVSRRHSPSIKQLHQSHQQTQNG